MTGVGHTDIRLYASCTQKQYQLSCFWKSEWLAGSPSRAAATKLVLLTVVEAVNVALYFSLYRSNPGWLTSGRSEDGASSPPCQWCTLPGPLRRRHCHNTGTHPLALDVTPIILSSDRHCHDVVRIRFVMALVHTRWLSMSLP